MNTCFLIVLLIAVLMIPRLEGYKKWPGGVGPSATGYGGTDLDINPKIFDYAFMENHQ